MYADESSRYVWHDRTRGVIWIAIPKCASTSISQVIATGDSYQMAGKPIPEQYYSVMFIRHPWQRLLRAMRHLEVETMDDMVLRWMNGDCSTWNQHIRPYWAFHRQYRVDFVGRLESMDEDWGRLQKEIEVPSLSKVNSSGSSTSWESLDFDWSRISHVYDSDFQLFERLDNGSDSNSAGHP